jgi:hypothetical protein
MHIHRKVEDAMRKTYEYLASVKDNAIRKSFGIDLNSDSSESESDSENDCDNQLNSTNEEELPLNQPISKPIVNSGQLIDLLRKCNLNWF